LQLVDPSLELRLLDSLDFNRDREAPVRVRVVRLAFAVSRRRVTLKYITITVTKRIINVLYCLV
jgi:hypothetical protein